MLAIGDADKKVTLVSAPDMEDIAELRHDGDVRILSFSPCGTMLAGGGGTDQHHGLMTHKGNDTSMKTVVWHVSPVGEECKYLGSALFKDVVHAVRFSPSGNWLAVGGEDRAISLLSVAKGFEKVLELPSAAGVRCLAWSPDSRFLVAGGEDMKISVWNLISRQLLFQLPKAMDWYCDVVFHPEMFSFATCSFSDPSVTIHPLTVSEQLVHSAEEQEEVDEDEYGDEEFEDDPDLPAAPEIAPLISVGMPAIMPTITPAS